MLCSSDTAISVVTGLIEAQATVWCCTHALDLATQYVAALMDLSQVLIAVRTASTCNKPQTGESCAYHDLLSFISQEEISKSAVLVSHCPPKWLVGFVHGSIMCTWTLFMLTTRLTGCFVIGACVLQNLFLVHEMCLLSKQTLRMTLLAFTFINTDICLHSAVCVHERCAVQIPLASIKWYWHQNGSFKCQCQLPDLHSTLACTAAQKCWQNDHICWEACKRGTDIRELAWLHAEQQSSCVWWACFAPDTNKLLSRGPT